MILNVLLMGGETVVFIYNSPVALYVCAKKTRQIIQLNYDVAFSMRQVIRGWPASAVGPNISFVTNDHLCQASLYIRISVI